MYVLEVNHTYYFFCKLGNSVSQFPLTDWHVRIRYFAVIQMYKNPKVYLRTYMNKYISVDHLFLRNV